MKGVNRMIWYKDNDRNENNPDNITSVIDNVYCKAFTSISQLITNNYTDNCNNLNVNKPQIRSPGGLGPDPLGSRWGTCAKRCMGNRSCLMRWGLFNEDNEAGEVVGRRNVLQYSSRFSRERMLHVAMTRERRGGEESSCATVSLDFFYFLFLSVSQFFLLSWNVSTYIKRNHFYC